MCNQPAFRRRSAALGALACSLALARVATAQLYNPADPSTHPAWITRDGTTLTITDVASVPLSGNGGSITSFGANANLSSQLSRVNFLRSAPTTNASQALQSVEANRFFVADNNRNLYILNKSQASANVTGAGFTPYINFQSVFPEFDNNPGFAGGLVTFQFDPGYADPASAGFGKFYTVHTENLNAAPPASARPINANLPGLTGVAATVGGASSYTVTTPVNPPAGNVARHSVLVEWKDTNPLDNAFQGSAREVMRVGFNGNLHPMGDLAFNPNAKPGDADYRNLYIAMGDGGAGETTNNQPVSTIPQRLDSLQGKVLRITPDVNLRPADALGSNGSGSYRVPTTGPDANPFAQVAGARDEVFALGFRNVHRLSWDAPSGALMGNDIGLYSYEEVNLIVKGGNYGWSEREGTRVLNHASAQPGDSGASSVPGSRSSSSLPDPDTLPFRVSDTQYVASFVSGAVTSNTANAQQSPVRYAAAQYFQTEGDAIASGFVYRGTMLQGLQGKYIFGDITTGRLFFADFAEMTLASDFDPATLATVHELSFRHNNGAVTLYQLIAQTFDAKGGNLTGQAANGALPGYAANVGGARGCYGAG